MFAGNGSVVVNASNITKPLIDAQVEASKGVMFQNSFAANYKQPMSMSSPT
jgi:hypothetical protein